MTHQEPMYDRSGVSTPPKLALRLLHWRLPPEEREFLLGDLEEAFLECRARSGTRSARAWYWREALHAALQTWPSPRPLPHNPRETPMKSLVDDIRFAFRMLARAPGTSALTIFTLALGVGATTAIFSVVYPALLQPSAFPQPNQLVLVWERDRDGAASNLGYLTFRDLERETRSIESMAAMSYWQPVISGVDAAERLAGQRVTQRFFHTLGIKPMLGRDFLPEEDRNGSNRVVILGYGLWQRRFAGDSSIVGWGVPISGVTYTVVGVLPPDFESLLAPGTDIWGPLGYDASLPWACRSCRHLRAIARVKDGLSPATAEAELSRISATIVRQFPNEYPASGAVLQPLHDMVIRSAKPALTALVAAVAFVLLISCVNAANLMLGRALRRESEFGVRTALGAGRGRLVRLVVTESLVASVIAGGLATLLAVGAVRWLVRLAPPGIPRIEHVSVNGLVLGFAILLALVSGAAAGLVPAFAASRSELHGMLKSGARGLTGGIRHRLRGGMVVAEVAMAVTLLAGAALLFKSVGHLLAVETGFESHNRLSMEVDASGPAYRDDAVVRRFWASALDAVRGVPAVASAAVVSQLPLGGNIDMYGIHLEDHPNPNPELDPSALRYAISPDYLVTMGIPLLRGRGVAAEDLEKSPEVVVISRAMADALFRGTDPIGRRLKIGGTDGPWRTIVGITGNTRHRGLDSPHEFQFYLPLTQWWGETGMTLVVKTAGSPAGAATAIRSAVQTADRTAAITKVATLDELVTGSVSQRRFALVLFELFALVALVLAAAGIFGVLSASVAERTREIGIRTALGAPRDRILGMVVRHGLGLTVAGFVLGVGGALALSRVLGKLLYGVQPYDAGAMVTVALFLTVIAVAACALPAWRAVRVDPVSALREG